MLNTSLEKTTHAALLIISFHNVTLTFLLKAQKHVNISQLCQPEENFHFQSPSHQTLQNSQS